MEWLWLVAILLVALGVAGLLMPMLPGVPLLFGGLLLGAWIDHFSRVSALTIVVIGVFALIAWGIDFVASLMTAKSAGGSRLALWGTMMGAVVGILGGVVGLIIGPIIGAVTGEMLAHRDPGRAAKVGMAAGVGFVLALVVKLVLAAVMIGIFAYAYFI